MKIVVNRCYGGFSLSIEATRALYRAGCTEIATPIEEYFGAGTKFDTNGSATRQMTEALVKWDNYLRAGSKDMGRVELSILCTLSDDKKFALDTRPNNRADPRLVKIVEEMGEKANGGFAKLKVIEIPDDVDWEIDDYDGMETVEEKHRSW